MVRLRSALGDRLVSTGALTILLLTLAALDGRVREQVALRLNRARASTDLVLATTQIRDLAIVVFEAARDQSIERAPLVIFALAATVLVLFMLRL